MNSIPVEITMLNSMAGADFTASLDRHVEWKLKSLDLKDCILGKKLVDLTDSEAGKARNMIEARHLAVHCFSTTLFHLDVEQNQPAFQLQLQQLSHLLRLAGIMKPKVIRLLSATTNQRATLSNAVDYLQSSRSWIFDIYRDAIDQISSQGYTPMIENEVGNSIFSSPEEIVQFFEILDKPAVKLIFDIGNLWQMGTSPSLASYETLRPLIASLHLKGGRSDGTNARLKYAAALEDSSWPIKSILQKAIADGVRVICLNPPHGERPGTYDYSNLAARDLAFVRRCISEGSV